MCNFWDNCCFLTIINPLSGKKHFTVRAKSVEKNSICIQRLQRLRSTHFHRNQGIFYILDCHIGFRNFEWRLVIGDLKNAQVIFIPIKYIFIFSFVQWIRHFEFRNFECRFVIRDLENLWILIFITIK